jgi:hypothetical protein
MTNHSENWLEIILVDHSENWLEITLVGISLAASFTGSNRFGSLPQIVELCSNIASYFTRQAISNLTLTNPHLTLTPHPARVIPLHNLGNKIPVAGSVLGDSITGSLPKGAEH